MDISTLSKKGIKNTIEIHIDSSLRDTSLYRYPNEYTIEFIENFKNVVALEIVDAHIPKTEFIINSNNNVIVFRFDNDTTETCEVPIGDYDANQFVNVFNNLFNKLGIRVYNSAQTYQLILISNTYFEIDLIHTTINKVFGFGDFTKRDNKIISINDIAQYTYNIYQPLSTNVSYIVSDLNKVYIQELHPEKTTHLYKIQIPTMSVKAMNNFINDIEFNICITNHIGEELHTVTSKTPIFLFDKPPLLLEGGEVYYVKLFFSKKRWDVHQVNIPVHSETCIHYTHVVQNTISGKFVLNNSTLLNTFHNPYNAINMEIMFENKLFSITSPGRYNFHGDDYIVMRCVEVDTHTSNGIKREDDTSYIFGTILRLSVLGSNEYKFVPNLKLPQEFAPISKISRLSFRFENIKGDLYDFKGINHNFTIRIYLINMIQNTDDPLFTEQEHEQAQIEAINEHIQYYNV